MAGLYIHIPFCRDACNYCDFHFSISLQNTDSMLDAIKKEIAAEKDYLGGELLETIYFGGGTPSVMDPYELGLLLDTIRKNYTLDSQAEITLEANPDDLNQDYLVELIRIGVNRLSIGIQSFHDEDLNFMNRRHDSGQAIKCIENAQKSGFDNMNLDLIYGLPEMSIKKWEKNLDIALTFNPTHLAAYHLSYETGTVLDYRRKKRKVEPMNENGSFDQFIILSERMESEGYEHYEISNFALPGGISKHNSAYWRGNKYLGVGPSAHSFNGLTRRWNMSKNSSYVKRVLNGHRVYEEETLDKLSRLHDYLMTSLRTKWGTDIKFLKKEWGREYSEHVLLRAKPFIQSGMVLIVDGKLILTREGMFIADHIIADLFL